MQAGLEQDQAPNPLSSGNGKRGRDPAAEAVADQGSAADLAGVEGLEQIPQVTLDVPGRLPARITVTAEIDGGNRVPTLRKMFSELREDAPVLPTPWMQTTPSCLASPQLRVLRIISGSSPLTDGMATLARVQIHAWRRGVLTRTHGSSQVTVVAAGDQVDDELRVGFGGELPWVAGED